MRIIGGHDYYDSAMAFGRDTETVFVRHKKDSNKQKLKWRVPEVDGYIGEYRWREIDHYFPIVVYFCDTIYRGVYYDETNRRNPPFSLRHFIWKASDIDIEKVGREKSWYYRDDLPREWRLTKSTVAEYFIPQKMTKAEIDRMIDGRIAIAYFIWISNEEGMMHVNEEGLRDIGFQKAVDPWTAFQELSMWVGGVLPKSGNPMVEIEDNKMKIAKAGFDNKVSFRHPIKLERN